MIHSSRTVCSGCRRFLCLALSVSLLVSMALAVEAQEPCPPSDRAAKPLEDPIPQPIPTGDRRIGLQTVVDQLTAPVYGTAVRGCQDGSLFVADQIGVLWQIDLNGGKKTVFLDVRERLVRLIPAYDERGLLGVAFHPDFCRNGLFYTHTSEPPKGKPDFSTMPPGTAPDHHSVLTEWRVEKPQDPQAAAAPKRSRELMRIAQPQMNHNGGTLTFGPDGMLFISLGDGGAADDQGIGHVPGGNGQAPSNILGSIARIDPTGSNAANGAYGIPPDNPFVDDPKILDELFAYGLRNPYRIAFDRQSGKLYGGDVGQNEVEEIDVIRAGGNYGWRCREGTFDFHPNGQDRGFVTRPRAPAPQLIAPIAQYDHDEGHAVIGGFVYRGSDLPDLQGVYVFGDYHGRLFYLDPEDGRGQRPIREFRLADDRMKGLHLLGFGEDARGELYVLANQPGAPSGETGVVFKIVPASR